MQGKSKNGVPQRRGQVGVMLSDEVASAGVETKTKERGASEEQNGGRAEEVGHSAQEGRLRDNIDEIVGIQGLGVDNERSNAVGKSLKQDPNELHFGWEL